VLLRGVRFWALLAVYVAHGYEHVDWDIAGWVMGGPLDVFVHDIIHGALDLLCGG